MTRDTAAAVVHLIREIARQEAATVAMVDAPHEMACRARDAQLIALLTAAEAKGAA
jgi:hypothetical protein